MRCALTLALVLLVGFSSAMQGQDKKLQNAINQSVVGGVAYLRQIQQADGTWPHDTPEHSIGATALAGLTLLECGARKDDPAIVKAAKAVRKAAPDADKTYGVSLSIMFLDRLGDALDIPIIEVLGARLLTSNAPGAWVYDLDLSFQERLAEYVKRCEEGTARPGTRATQLSELPRDIQDMVSEIPALNNFDGLTGDNSNTQFATLALWVARRYGLPVEKRLVSLDKIYRASQHPKGGWGYSVFEPEPEDKTQLRPAMMCTGLIGMAAYYGAKKETAKKPILEDPAVQKALNAVGKYVGKPNGLKRVPALPTAGNDEKPGGNAYYYLWTLERTAMLYGLKQIGGNDWYVWGSEIIVAHQARDGSWKGDYPEGGADTCFALLFLKRSNIAPDLTIILLQGIQKDSASPSKAPSGSEPARKDSTSAKPSATAEARAEAVQLTTSLLEAPPADVDAILEKIRQGKGTPFDQSLSATIPQLKGEAQTKARKTLTQRLASLPAPELRKQLKAIDVEIRRAAASACALAKTKEAVPDLIDLLADSQSGVAQNAYQSLREITAQDFGPAAGASRLERDKAIRAWKEWWKKNQN